MSLDPTVLEVSHGCSRRSAAGHDAKQSQQERGEERRGERERERGKEGQLLKRLARIIKVIATRSAYPRADWLDPW
jgi:hypothetical protein